VDRLFAALYLRLVMGLCGLFGVRTSDGAGAAALVVAVLLALLLAALVLGPALWFFAHLSPS